MDSEARGLSPDSDSTLDWSRTTTLCYSHSKITKNGQITKTKPDVIGISDKHITKSTSTYRKFSCLDFSLYQRNRGVIFLGFYNHMYQTTMHT